MSWQRKIDSKSYGVNKGIPCFSYYKIGCVGEHEHIRNALTTLPLNEFKQTVRIKGRRLEFSFRRVYTPDGEKYFVSVSENGHFYPFEIRKDNMGKWTVSDLAPKWIKELEETLSDIIDQHIDLP